MNNIFKFLGLTAIAFAAFASCSPEKINHPSEAGIPDATSIEPVITVDQELNQVTFSLPAGTRGVIPVWLFQDKTGEWTQYSALNGLTKIFTAAGDYTVRMQLMNSNGVSPNHREATFHIDNTLMNFDKYNTMLTGGEAKEWRIDNSVQGHMGCGPSGTTGTEWWSAAPDDKKDWGVYDNRMNFILEGNVYKFNPGAAGTIYVNTGITDEPYGSHNTNDGQDYRYPVEEQTSEWNWEVDGEDLYLVLPANTYWPYYATTAFIANPRLKVESITTKNAELVADNGEIAWHFTITSGAAEVKFNGFNYNHEANLWKPADAEGAHTFTQFYAPGWAETEKPEISENNGKYSFNLPVATTDQWQCQFMIIPNSPLTVSSAVNYDFSCIINASKDINGVTVKLVDTSNDGNFFFTERVDVKALEDYIFYTSDMAGIDAENIKMVFDFGGNPENTDITVGSIVLKDHSIDDGTVLPETPDVPENQPEEYVYDSESNLWKPADAAHSYWYYYAPGWAQTADPATENTGSEYKLTLPSATTDQWQCQFMIIPDEPIALSAANSYDFSVVLNASADLGNVTLKLTDASDDGNFLFTETVKLTAFEDYIFDLSDKKLSIGDAAAVKMVFDFGGNPENTEVVIKRIVLKDHSVDDGTHKGGSGSNPGLDPSGTELWDNGKVTEEYWYSAGDWSGALTPEITRTGNGWKVVVPDGIGGSEWQGQTKFTLDAPANSGKKYDFGVTLNCSSDCVCTVKLAWAGNDKDHAFFYDGNVALKAYEDIQYVQSGIAPDTDYDKIILIFDFGRTPGGSEVEIKDIHLYEH